MIVNVCEVLKKCKDNNAYCEHMVRSWYKLMSRLCIYFSIYFLLTQLHRFYRQLTADKSYVFTAFGMFQIERPILTSVSVVDACVSIVNSFLISFSQFQLSAAITTYLVILIQLQRNDDKKGNIN